MIYAVPLLRCTVVNHRFFTSPRVSSFVALLGWVRYQKPSRIIQFFTGAQPAIKRRFGGIRAHRKLVLTTVVARHEVLRCNRFSRGTHLQQREQELNRGYKHRVW